MWSVLSFSQAQVFPWKCPACTAGLERTCGHISEVWGSGADSNQQRHRDEGGERPREAFQPKKNPATEMLKFMTGSRMVTSHNDRLSTSWKGFRLLSSWSSRPSVWLGILLVRQLSKRISRATPSHFTGWTISQPPSRQPSSRRLRSSRLGTAYCRARNRVQPRRACNWNKCSTPFSRVERE